MPAKFKVGDKVKIFRLEKDAIKSETYQKLLNKVVTITRVVDNYVYCDIDGIRCSQPLRHAEVRHYTKPTLIICNPIEE